MKKVVENAMPAVLASAERGEATEQTLPRLYTWLRLGIPIALGVATVSLFLYTVLARAVYPFALEWIEGNSFVHVVRLLEGKPLYTRPSFEFIPTIKTPFFFYASAALARLGFPVMAAMRLVSVAAALLGAAFIYNICRARRLSVAAGLVGVSLFLGTYGATGFYLDIGRMDTLMLTWLLAAAWLIVLPTSQDVLAGLLAAAMVTLAFATKQPATAAVFVWGLLLLVERRWRRLISFLSGSAIFIGGYILFENWRSGGWFWFYVFDVPGNQRLIPEMWLRFWTDFVWPVYPLWAGLVLAGVLVQWWGKPWKTALGELFKLGLLAAPFVGMAYMVLLKIWGYWNGMIPLTAGFAIIGAEAYQYLFFRQNELDRNRWLLAILGWGLLVGQVWSWRYDPRTQIPSQRDLAAGRELVAELRRSPMPLYIPTAPYLTYMAGRPIHYMTTSLGDIGEAAKRNPVAKQIYEVALQEITPRQMAATVLLPDRPWALERWTEAEGYQCRMLGPEQMLVTLNGAIQRLNRLCVKAP